MDDPAGATNNQPAATPPAPTPPAAADPSVNGPLDRATATALLERADELLDSGDLGDAARFYERVVGFDDAAITAAALLGLGTVFYRADQEDVAIAYWRRVLELPETPGTYLAWRQLAAAHVRAGELQDAIRAYREAERRAPAEDRAEIAARLGWLAKETGDKGAARRYFARSRGGTAAPYLTYSIIALTAVVSLLAFFPEWAFLMDALQLDKPAVAAGELYRLLTVTLLHGSLLHLLFNMYALYFAGSLVEQIYGWRVMGVMYILTGLAASTASFVFGGDIPSVGASGAVYGMFGVLLAASRTHNPVLDRRGQAVIGQIGVLIAINLVISFATPGIDYQAHIGGLLAGVWLGFLFVPGRVPTLSRMWQMPAGGGSSQGVTAFRILGVVALVIVIIAGVMIGTAMRV
jgi:membrane associated rhomboid family serine protease